MASRWEKPDYRIGNSNRSTYNPLSYNTNNNNAPTDTGNRYYKSRHDGNDVTGRKGKDDDINYVSYDRVTQQNQQHPPLQTYRDDPRYGSATRRAESQTPDADLSLRLNDPYDDVTSKGHMKGSWTDRDPNGGVIDPRTGNNSYYSMASHRSALKHGGALLFIRFPTGSGPGRTDNIGVASQAFLRSKTFDMGGKFLGIAKAVYDFGYPSGTKDAIGLYHFPNTEKAKLFFQYDVTLRQPDFPPPYGHAEMWTVSNAYLPDNLDEYNTFLLSEVMLHHGRDKREFFEVFQKPFERYLSQNGVMPFVICSYGANDRQCLRRHAYPNDAIITCHLFRGLNHLRWLSDQETYLRFRSLHNQMADERCSVFTIQRNLCP